MCCAYELRVFSHIHFMYMALDLKAAHFADTLLVNNHFHHQASSMQFRKATKMVLGVSSNVVNQLNYNLQFTTASKPNREVIQSIPNNNNNHKCHQNIICACVCVAIESRIYTQFLLLLVVGLFFHNSNIHSESS